MIAIGVISLLIPAVFTFSPRATLQWWMETGLLIGFAMALTRMQIPRAEFSKWFVFSLIPHALLALWQFFVQAVVGIKWFGIAAQDPLARGVSVIAAAGHRILRAYGGLPHPNILGGWLAIALPSLTTSFPLRAGREKWLWLAITFLFTSALVLTFSRAAWIAAAIGIMFVLIKDRRGYAAVLSTIAVAVALTGFIARVPLFARADLTERLETKSFNERAFAWRQGWEIFREHPLVGIGYGSTILGLSEKDPWKKHDASLGSPVPPHNVPQLVLIELGLLGLLGIVILYGYSSTHLLIYSPFISSLFILSIFDHYPWSLWSGKALVMTVYLLTFLL